MPLEDLPRDEVRTTPVSACPLPPGHTRPTADDPIDWGVHRGSCRIFYAERRCTCSQPPPSAPSAGHVHNDDYDGPVDCDCSTPSAGQPGERDSHRLRFRDTGFGVLYACSCDDWEEVANDDTDAARVYRLHGEHIAAAAGVCECGCDETDHGIDSGCIHCQPCWAYAPRASVQPAPSAGQDTEPWRVGKHYGIHVYEGDRPVATFHRPEDAQRAVDAVNARPRQEAGQDTERLRDEVCTWLAAMYGGEEYAEQSGSNEHWTEMADELLALPALRRLIAERDEAREEAERRLDALIHVRGRRDDAVAKVQRLEALAVELNRDPYSDWRADDVAAEICRALEPPT